MSACTRAAVASSTVLAGIHLRPDAKVGALSLTTKSRDCIQCHLESCFCTLKLLRETDEGQLEDTVSIEACGGKEL